MTKADMAKAIAKRHDLTQKEALSVINAVLDTITGSLARGGKVELRGFGSFYTKNRNSRMARNPKTGEKVFVPAKRVPSFKASRSLKELVSKGYY